MPLSVECWVGCQRGGWDSKRVRHAMRLESVWLAMVTGEIPRNDPFEMNVGNRCAFQAS